MKNSDYWKQRFEQLEEAQNEQGVTAVTEIEKQYKETQKQLEGQISQWYQRFADNNKITLAEARKYLNSADLKEFKWDVQDYIKYGQDNALTGGWMKELENASAKYHISKLEALKTQTQQSLEVMFSKQLETVTRTMSNVVKSGYYHTAYELQKGFNIGWNIAGLDQSKIEKVLAKPWAVDGKNFSERIWGNKEKLISEVHNELTRNIMTSSDPQKAIDSLAKKMNTSKHNAGSLVMTEEAYFSSVAQKDCFNDLNVEEYEIVATLDSHTSDICRSLDGKHFPMEDYQAGDTAPPFHVCCRSTTVPYFSDDFGQIGERAAKDNDGKTYYIPDDINYQEWKKTFVDSEDKSGFDVLYDGSTAHYSHNNSTANNQSPKKEYLTKKKLKAKIAEADVQIEDLQQKIADALEYPSYNDFTEMYECVDDAGKGVDEAYTIVQSRKEIDALERKYGGYQELLDNGTQADRYAYDEYHKKISDANDKLNQYGRSVDMFGSDQDIKQLYSEFQDAREYESQLKVVKAQKAEWEENLTKKVKAEQKKTLLKQQEELEAKKAAVQQKLDNFKVKTYSGIWKEKKTTADWNGLNIEGKKKYYEGKFITETNSDKIKKYKSLYAQLEELDAEGKNYNDIQAEIDKIEQELKKIQSDLQNLENSDIINVIDEDAFSEERKQAALWFNSKNGGFKAADDYFDPPAKKVHDSATIKENTGFYTYTSGSGGHNRPLAGFQKRYSDPGSGWEEEYFKGSKNVWIDYEGKGDEIRGLTMLIEKSVYDADVWLQSGQEYGTLEGFLGIPSNTLASMTDEELQRFVGRENVMHQFISTAVCEGGGSIFNSRPVKLNIYAPKGSQMLYASDLGAFGKAENEMILQRGGTYKITKIYKGKDHTDGGKEKIFVDVEIHPEKGYDLFQQDPSEWKGSKENYRSR